MANYADLKAAVAAVIKQNGSNEITGEVLKSTLLSIISSLGEYPGYGGLAIPVTNPGSVDQNVYFLTNTPGVYPNFGGVTIPDDSLYLLELNNASQWVFEKILEKPTIAIADNLSTSDPNTSLAAPQGMVLDKKIDDVKKGSLLSLKNLEANRIGIYTQFGSEYNEYVTKMVEMISGIEVNILTDIAYNKLLSGFSTEMSYAQVRTTPGENPLVSYQFRIKYNNGSPSDLLYFIFAPDGVLVDPLIVSSSTSILLFDATLSLNPNLVLPPVNSYIFLLSNAPDVLVSINSVIEKAIVSYIGADTNSLNANVSELQDSSEVVQENIGALNEYNEVLTLRYNKNFEFIDISKFQGVINPAKGIRNIRIRNDNPGLPEIFERYISNGWDVFLTYMNIANYKTTGIRRTGNLVLKNGLGEVSEDIRLKITADVSGDAAVSYQYFYEENGVEVLSGFYIVFDFAPGYFDGQGSDNYTFISNNYGLMVDRSIFLPWYGYSDIDKFLIPNNDALSANENILLNDGLSIQNAGSGFRAFYPGALADDKAQIQYDVRTNLKTEASNLYYRTSCSRVFSPSATSIDDMDFSLFDLDIIAALSNGLRYNPSILPMDSAHTVTPQTSNIVVTDAVLGDILVYFDFPYYLLDQLNSSEYPARILGYANSTYYTLEYMRANPEQYNYFYKYVLNMKSPIVKAFYNDALSRISDYFDTNITVNIDDEDRTFLRRDVIDSISMCFWGWWGEGEYKVTGWNGSAGYDAYSEVFPETSEDLIEYVEMYKTHFPDKFLLAPTNGMWANMHDGALLNLQRYFLDEDNNFGFFIDNYGGNHRNRIFVDEEGTRLLTNRYKTAPVVCETYQMVVSTNTIDYPYYSLVDVGLYYKPVRINPMNINRPENYPLNRHNAYDDPIIMGMFKKIFSYICYRVVFWGFIGYITNGTLNLKINLKNIGLTPIYDDYWSVQFVIKNENDEIIETITSTFDIRTLLPDFWKLTLSNSKAVIRTKSVTYAKCRVYLQIVDSKGIAPKFAFSQTGRNDNGEYFLGTLS